MLSEGLAWHYKGYSDSKEYSKIGENARKQRKGIFRQKNPTPPWEYRQKVKKMKAEQKSNAKDKKATTNDSDSSCSLS